MDGDWPGLLFCLAVLLFCSLCFLRGLLTGKAWFFISGLAGRDVGMDRPVLYTVAMFMHFAGTLFSGLAGYAIAASLFHWPPPPWPDLR